MNQTKFVTYLNAVKPDIHFGNRRGSEENIKIKCIVPLFQYLGWNIVKDMDFERFAADIVLFDSFEGAAQMVVEAKAWDELITSHLERCLEYAYKAKTPWLVISSGQ